MSESESDEDYIPGEPEQLSEEGSADEETDIQYENELATKRKITKQNSSKKKQKTMNTTVEEQPNIDLPEVPVEIVKENEEELWSKFLEGTDTKAKSVLKDDIIVAETNKCEDKKAQILNVHTPKDNDETKVYEFAGEKVVVQGRKVLSTDISTASSSPQSGQSLQNSASKPRRSGGGLSSLLSQIGKKNKLSTLEKTKLDWDTFKQDEGIEEELKTFNKGKEGYLERQDFLERADLRQFEIEKSLRTSRRGNR